MTRRRISLREALDDRQLLGNELTGDSWLPWRALLLASMGEPLTDSERDLFRKLTQRDHEPHVRVEEMVVVKGRRAGGSSATGKALIPSNCSEVLSLSIKVCVSVSPALDRGGQMWVYLNWCLGLKETGCRVVWLDKLASGTGRTPTQQFSDLQTRVKPYGLGGEVVRLLPILGRGLTFPIHYR
jgi:hypothetical protein